MARINVVALCVLAFAVVVNGSAGAQAPSGPVTIVTILDVLSNANVPQNVESSNALLNKLVVDTQKAPGVVSIKVLREASRSNHFIVLAVFQDMNAYEQYKGAETTRAFRQALQPRMGGPFDERIYVDLKQ